MSALENITHNVVRLTSTFTDGRQSVGTGFYFALHRTEQKTIPIIITNKHVVQGSVKTLFKLSVKKLKESVTEMIDIGIASTAWINHPDPNVDLCAMPFAQVLNVIPPENKVIWNYLTEENMPKQEDWDAISSVEDVIMVGYPNGIWDSVNNRPIYRKGITATNARVNYLGEPKFLVDIAAYPGSSGSPVFIYRDGLNVVNTAGTQLAGKKSYFFLAGILFAVHTYNAQGEMIVEPLPTDNSTRVSSKIPTNLGIVLKSNLIYDFKKVIPNALTGGVQK
ncbi:MAG: serine protease [Flavobacteriales bacterium]|nr:serine protease [Flavobacteriales bacterium]